MSQCFRPVKEVWNSHSSCFLEPKALITLLHDLAARADTASDEHNYGDNSAIWFEDGGKVLDYIRSDHRSNPESFKDSLEEQGVLVETDALVPLLANMQSLSDQWRDSIGEHGELVFYVDNC
jgi:hypothetical protein